MGTKASSYFPLTSVSTMACWHKKAVADSRWDWTTLPRCSQPAAPDRANQGGTSHLEIHLETELTDHSWTWSRCTQILHKCSPQWTSSAPPSCWHSLSPFGPQQPALPTAPSLPPVRCNSSALTSLQLVKPNLIPPLLSWPLSMTAPRAPAQALLMHWQRHLSFRENPNNHSSPFCFPLSPTPLAHHSNYTFFPPPTLCASFLSHQIKATFVHSQDLPRANHSLIHYLCLLLPSISPSCHLSSHTRHFQTSFVLSSVLFLIQRRGQPASYLIDLFQTLLSNLCLHTEEKLAISASCGCAEPILPIRSCRFAFPTALSPLVASCLGHTELFRAGAISVHLLLYIYEPWLGI